MTTRKFSKSFMLGVLYSDESSAILIEDKLIDHSRWSLIYNLVFKHGDKFYKTTFSRGKTESQDEEPFEYCVNEEVECIEVSPIEKTIIDYEPI